MTRTDAIARAHHFLHSGEFLGELDRRVAYQTESQNPEKRDALRAYLTEDLQPAFSQLDFTTRLIESPTGMHPYLLAEYRENGTAPTVLMYGHGDVVDGMVGEWRDNLDPWRATISGNRVYGRGTADNKGQHSINMSAVRAVRDARGGRLGFNAKFLVETGEEIGSPDLHQVCEQLRDELKADLFLASDGPRLSADRPTLFLGCRGGIQIHLDVKLREGSHHSGNWGGVLANPATILASAIATLVDGNGRLQVDQLKPPLLSNQIRSALADVKIEPTPDEPALSENWGEEGVGRRKALCVEHARSAGIGIRQRRKDGERDSRSCFSRPATALRCRHQGRHNRRRDQGAFVRPRFSDGRGPGDAEVRRVTDGFRQSLGQLDGGVDPENDGKSSRGFAEFWWVAAQWRVFGCAGLADDVGAPFLSGLLPARTRRANSPVGHRRGARHHGGTVLGPRRDATPPLAPGAGYVVPKLAKWDLERTRFGKDLE
jgi:hypothetical protein